VGELRAADLIAIREQLGRDPTTPFSVVVRCQGGHPLVIRNRPIDLDGNPFPTLFWLTCPDAHRAVARLESVGRIRELNERCDDDPVFAAEVERAHRDHARERARYLPAAEAFGGVGGTRTGVKCLHAHYANHLAGGDDPIGAIVAAEIEPPHGPTPPGRVAAVDQGTNSIRLLILEADGTELARDMVITRLGDGVDRTGRMDLGSLDRTLDMLGIYVRRARALGVQRIRIAATSAVRDASNRAAYENGVEAVAGVVPEIVNGIREAELSFRGAVAGLEAPAPFCVLDIGGGSTEFALGTAGPDHAVSLQMGSVRLTERHLRSDPPAPEEMRAMLEEIRASLGEVDVHVPVSEAETVIAVAGTATTMRAISLDLEVHDPDLIHHGPLALAEAEAVFRALARMTLAERTAIPVMAPGRAEVIVAGAAVLVEVMRRWGIEQVIVSEHDILDGHAAELLSSR